MYTRLLAPPDRSFFLFGPRGTGKTTWLRQRFADAHLVDLVHDTRMFALLRDPGRFSAEVHALPSGAWVLVDEVQRLPALLNEVQALITEHPDRWRFVLTGSSARRLRREGANLLPGRVINRQFFPLVVAELGEMPPVDTLLRFGGLPAVCSEPSPTHRVDLLDAYVANYVGQEVRLEAAVKHLDAFTRFLEVAALANGQVTNVASLARDASVARPTVQGYFEVLVDTLLGVWLPAWRPRAKVKEVGHPKFFFFDPGVARALGGRTREPLDAAERGHLLETWVFHELRAHREFAGLGGAFSYWRARDGAEVDFVWTRGGSSIGIEVKSAREWRREDGRTLAALTSDGTLTGGVGVYLGDTMLEHDGIRVWPLPRFLEALRAGDILPPPA